MMTFNFHIQVVPGTLLVAILVLTQHPQSRQQQSKLFLAMQQFNVNPLDDSELRMTRPPRALARLLPTKTGAQFVDLNSKLAYRHQLPSPGQEDPPAPVEENPLILAMVILLSPILVEIDSFLFFSVRCPHGKQCLLIDCQV